MKSRKEDIKILKNRSPKPIRNRLMIGTATLGIVRMEWAAARFGQVIPCNWTAAHSSIGFSQSIPMGYLVADAQNILVQATLQGDFQWLLLHEDDVVLPPDAFVTLNSYMKKEDIPVVSGLYYLKSSPPEPLMYRGRGNSCYDKWKLGDLVWVDGVPTGCLLIHSSILKVMYEESEDYMTGNGVKCKKVFETPAKVWHDPETNTSRVATGTSDIYWCDRVMREDVLRRAGWKKIGKRKWPFLVDTRIYCRHVDLTTGRMYPA